ncbi:DUF805 domain-containing protein [Streptomyces sp. H10-C2]|uniref:DUF805 domain-containing protein n=1 Tax=unclassified Streptomyces TaxID=2593676 RepID=UPI0024BA0AB7|nr:MULTISPECIES: DUF805 domain-containing protein [unclassified Streptomyces]MDJ0345790.1 DUF805 domain-containing protein [Streptomyces sp. PH10-H1]MDJ0374680.1 DUF805 domain-containing protein [Streptomyces sp. H10-C2]
MDRCRCLGRHRARTRRRPGHDHRLRGPHQRRLIRNRTARCTYDGPAPERSARRAGPLRSVPRKYATFSGRARRREFWMFALVNTAITIALIILDARIDTDPYLQYSYALATLLPSLAVTVRRLHDVVRSGVNIFWGAIPLIGLIILTGLLAGDGEPYINKYGPNPKTGYPDYADDDAEFAKSHVRRYSDTPG